MTLLDMAIAKWGFEDSRTITIAVLDEIGRGDLAEQLYEVLTEEDE